MLLIAVKHRKISALLLYFRTNQDRSKAKEQSSVSFPECLVEVLIKWRIWHQNVVPGKWGSAPQAKPVSLLERWWRLLREAPWHVWKTTSLVYKWWFICSFFCMECTHSAMLWALRFTKIPKTKLLCSKSSWEETHKYTQIQLSTNEGRVKNKNQPLK